MQALTMRSLLACALALSAGCAEGHYYDSHGVITYGRYRHVEELLASSPPPAWAPTTQALPPNVTPADPVHRSFDGAVALAAIHAVDLSPCEARGAPRTYGHARITFDPGGAPAQVLIDAPPDLTSDAAACLGERLARVSTQAFDGGPITVGASYYTR